ncbi:MAG TPA: flagellar biosynthesis protein FliW [Campylobacterales bacterium]|nr:flagellar biosynthesis protein FliW [Campylobacterales bacterium]HIP58990.1 flagellar biosynthesis protein FliW [Campylobacterales bacterium]
MKVKIVAPIFGFENINEVQFENIDDFFSKVESGDVTFTLIDPSKLRAYSFNIPLFYKELLKLESDEDVSVYNIVIISSEIEKSKINFAAPIVINKKEKLLAQIALDETKYKEFGLAESISDYL